MKLNFPSRTAAQQSFCSIKLLLSAFMSELYKMYPVWQPVNEPYRSKMKMLTFSSDFFGSKSPGVTLSLAKVEFSMRVRTTTESVSFIIVTFHHKTILCYSYFWYYRISTSRAFEAAVRAELLWQPMIIHWQVYNSTQAKCNTGTRSLASKQLAMLWTSTSLDF